jgi:hypothetical protein
MDTELVHVGLDGRAATILAFAEDPQGVYALAGVALALWGAAMVMGGMFPMPDDRHGAFGLGLAGPLVPLFTLLALRTVPDARGMKLFLGFILAGSVVVLAIMLFALASEG